MRIYLAGVGTNFKYLEGLDNLAFLVSYYYVNNSDEKTVKYALANNIPLFLDSGAFSAMMSNAIIDLPTYTLYCNIYGSKYEVIASLDVIGDWEQTRKNHLYMKNEGVNSISTFHIDSPYEALIEILQEENYIALGVKGQQGQRKKMHTWLDECFKLRDKYNPSCRVHGFGLTTPSVMDKYPFHSIDGTTWMTAAARYGRIIVLKDKSFTWIHVNNKAQLTKHWELVRDTLKGGWDLEEGRLPGYERVSLRHNAESLIELARRLS